MTIQGMFDFLKSYKEAVDKVNNHPHTALTPDLIKAIENEYALGLKVEWYLPMFTPMNCAFCKNMEHCTLNQKTVCSQYEVESLEEFML